MSERVYTLRHSPQELPLPLFVVVFVFASCWQDTPSEESSSSSLSFRAIFVLWSSLIPSLPCRAPFGMPQAIAHPQCGGSPQTGPCHPLAGSGHAGGGGRQVLGDTPLRPLPVPPHNCLTSTPAIAHPTTWGRWAGGAQRNLKMAARVE